MRHRLLSALLVTGCVGDARSAAPPDTAPRVESVHIRLEVAHMALAIQRHFHAVKVVPVQSVRRVSVRERCVAELRCSNDDCDVVRVSRSAPPATPSRFQIGCEHRGYRSDTLAIIELDPFPMKIPLLLSTELAYEKGTTVHVSVEYMPTTDGRLNFVKYDVVDRTPGQPSRWK
jgi:hypothetical protein